MKITQSSDFSQLTTAPDLANYITRFAQEVSQALSGMLTFSDNIQNNIIKISFPAANQTVTVAHNLKRAPLGYILVQSNAPVEIFDGNVGNTSTTVSLQASAAAACSVMVF